MTATRSGSLSAVLLVAWSEVMILLAVDVHARESPVAPNRCTGWSARPFSVWPSTETAPSAVSVPSPMITCTLRRLSRPGQPAVQLVDDAGLAGVRRRPVRLGLDTRRAVSRRARRRGSTVRNTSAACSSALAGMQPRCRQVPPTFSFSTSATDRPADAAYSAAA